MESIASAVPFCLRPRSLLAIAVGASTGAAVALLLSGKPASAQPAPTPTTNPALAAPATQPAEPRVTLNLPENTPLKVLIDYVSQEFGTNFLYDDQLGNQRVTIKSPAGLPRSAMPLLLENALQMKGLALVDAGQPGWKRIVSLQQSAHAATQPSSAAPGADAASAIVQVFKLKYADATKLDLLVKPFLTQPGAASQPLAEQGLLVVTDYASNLKRIAAVVESIDQPHQEVGIEFFPVEHADPARLTQQLDQLLKAKIRSLGGDERGGNVLETAYDARTNQIVVIGPRERVSDARAVIAALDKTVTQEQSPIRFYKLANATAADVLTTIRSLEDDDAQQNGAAAGTGTGAPARGNRPRTGRPDAIAPSSSGQRSSGAVAPQDRFASAAGTSMSGGTGASAERYAAPGSATGGGASVGTIASDARRTPAGSASAEGAPAPLRDAVRSHQAKVTADPNTNSIIVVAPPDVQRLYEQMIRTLDKRRPQVLVECTIVTLDTTGGFQLGVDIGRRGGFNNNQIITFSNFGLSTPDPTTGRLTLMPGVGFNGALISSDIADVIVRALQQSTRARVSSAPRILVNDNNLGTLSSISEFPYASVNASQTVATTSFGDYAQAGTEITVTPHISESDYLQLEYSVSLSSFTGNPVTSGGVNGTTLPPPRKSDSVQSQVTIPDGSTIVVGGLNQKNFTQTIDQVPFLGSIPVLGNLFKSRTDSDATTTLFVFIRPVILRDDKFADLKFLSEQDVRAAELPPDLPASEPMTMR